MTSALAYHLEQAPPRVLVVLVLFQVFRQLVDASGQHRNLYFWRAGIVGRTAKLLDDDLFFDFA